MWVSHAVSSRCPAVRLGKREKILHKGWNEKSNHNSYSVKRVQPLLLGTCHGYYGSWRLSLQWCSKRGCCPCVNQSSCRHACRLWYDSVIRQAHRKILDPAGPSYGYLHGVEAKVFDEHVLASMRGSVSMEELRQWCWWPWMLQKYRGQDGLWGVRVPSSTCCELSHPMMHQMGFLTCDGIRCCKDINRGYKALRGIIHMLQIVTSHDTWCVRRDFDVQW